MWSRYTGMMVLGFVMLNKDQLLVTNPRDALHHGERAANKYRTCI